MTRDGAPERTYGGISASERVARRREQLLDAALELYGTRGFSATGVKDVCREAGVTDRYFYESFPDSEALFVAVFDRAADRLLEVVATSVAGVEPEPAAQSRAAIEAFVRALAEDPRTARIIFAESASAGPAAERHMRDTLRRFSSLVADTARPHLGPGTPDRLLTMAALSLVGAIEQVMREWQEGGVDASIEEITDYLVGLFLSAGTLGGLESA